MAGHGTPSRLVAANLHPMTDGKKLLDLRGIAAHCGLTYTTVKGYHALATRRRRDGESRPGDLPKEDDTIARSPVWYVETIDNWVKNRPGQGTGGGPKRKETRS